MDTSPDHITPCSHMHMQGNQLSPYDIPTTGQYGHYLIATPLVTAHTCSQREGMK